MTDDTLSMIRAEHIYPYCKLSDRGLEAIFAGFFNIVCLNAGDSYEARPGSFKYTSVVSGKVRIEGTLGRYAGRELTVETTRHAPFITHDEAPGLNFVAVEDALFLHGQGDVVDDIVSLDEMVRGRESELDVVELLMMRGAKSFATLPTQRLIEVFQRMAEQSVSKGDEVVKQDMKGDSFYFIKAGAAEVWREELEDDEPQHVATLGPGDGFGEEALILGGARNATVKMITPGTLRALDGESYNELVAQPSVIHVTNAQAQDSIANGAQLVDVRYDDEWEESHIPGAVHIPLSQIRDRIDELDRTRDVVVYCRSGRRSQVGAILLCQHGYSAVSMDGGILQWPGETVAP